MADDFIRRRSKIYAPLFIILAYLIFTEISYFFGPFGWPMQDEFYVAAYLVFANLALLFGYLSGVHYYKRYQYCGLRLSKIFWFCLILNIILVGFTSQFRSGSFFPDIAHGVQNTAEAYFSSNELRALGGAPIEYLRIVLSPVLLMTFPLFVFFFESLSRSARILGFAFLVWWGGMYVAIGTNKALADYVVLTPILMYLALVSNGRKFSSRRLVWIFVLILALMYSFLSFFGQTQKERMGGVEKSIYLPSLNLYADQDNFLVCLFPDQIKPAAIALHSYLTQGYYGLYLSLNKDFEPTWGLGHSMFLSANFEKLTSIDLSKLTYPYRIASDGWDPLANWHSIYPWIASDLSFVGALFFVFFVGWFFAKTWCDVYYTRNPIAVVLLTQLLIMLFYFPANNQVFQSGEGLFGFLGVFVLWMKTRRRRVQFLTRVESV